MFWSEIHFDVVYLVCAEFIFPIKSQKKCRRPTVLRNPRSNVCLSVFNKWL